MRSGTPACSNTSTGIPRLLRRSQSAKSRHRIEPFPDFLQVEAFIDRLHGYLPGWDQPHPETLPSANTAASRAATGIREAVEVAAKRLGLDLSDDDLDDLAQDIVVMFLDFAATGLGDIFDMYPFRPPMRPWGCQSEQFREYVTLRVMAGMLAMLHTNPAGMDDFGECLGF
jgi:hypothetical protein